jgi:hypothetical protein
MRVKRHVKESGYEDLIATSLSEDIVVVPRGRRAYTKGDTNRARHGARVQTREQKADTAVEAAFERDYQRMRKHERRIAHLERTAVLAATRKRRSKSPA